jgi:hypothetical protein
VSLYGASQKDDDNKKRANIELLKATLFF